jgi:hypothetical protein
MAPAILIGSVRRRSQRWRSSVLEPCPAPTRPAVGGCPAIGIDSSTPLRRSERPPLRAPTNPVAGAVKARILAPQVRNQDAGAPGTRAKRLSIRLEMPVDVMRGVTPSEAHERPATIASAARRRQACCVTVQAFLSRDCDVVRLAHLGTLLWARPFASALAGQSVKSVGDGKHRGRSYALCVASSLGVFLRRLQRGGGVRGSVCAAACATLHTHKVLSSRDQPCPDVSKRPSTPRNR